jgi:hypothetical protein
MFKDEAVAQDLINNVRHTNIFGRKVDIKSAEPKSAHERNTYRRDDGGRRPPQHQPREYQRRDEYSTIPAYEGSGGDRSVAAAEDNVSSK